MLSAFIAVDHILLFRLKAGHTFFHIIKVFDLGAALAADKFVLELGQKLTQLSLNIFFCLSCFHLHLKLVNI